MNLKNLTFSVEGVHMDEHKTLTGSCPIERLDQPNIVHIPISQHIGTPCNPTVKVGDQVKVDQIVGTSDTFVSTNVHASVSGRIVIVSKRYTAGGRYCICVSVRDDGANTYVKGLEAFRNYEAASIDDIMAYVKKSGTVGMGGTGFPPHTRLEGEGPLLNVVILDDAECELYLTCDHRIMLERAEETLKRLKPSADLYRTKGAYVAVEENKSDTIERMEELIQDSPEWKDLKIASCQTKCPQGNSKRLSEVIINRIVPRNGVTDDVGVFLINVGTTLAFYKAIERGLLSIEHVITISSAGIEKPKNIVIPIGTIVGKILEFCGGAKENFVETVCDDPMTGRSVFDLDSPITKTTSGLLISTEMEKPGEIESPCIKYSRCVDYYPASIDPTDINAATLCDRIDLAELYHADQHMKCRICSFVCLAKRHLAESIRLARREIHTGSKK